jgi:hypothetical protein
MTPEFLPPAKELDLKQVKGLYFSGEKGYRLYNRISSLG